MAQEVGIDPYDGPDMIVKIAGGLRRVFSNEVTVRLCPPERAPLAGGSCERADGLEWSATVGFIKDWADPPWLKVSDRRASSIASPWS